MAGFDNETAFFTGIDNRGVQPVENQMVLDGQLIIGATATPNMRIGQLASADSSITYTFGAGTIDLSVDTSGIPTVATTYQADSGTATPAANILNVLGQPAGSIPVMYSTGSGSTLNIEDRTYTTKYVVDASSTAGLRGTYTTIQSAINAASSGDTIYIRSGTYTENLTLKAGVNLTAYETYDVTILGKCSFSSAGTVYISNLKLQTNSDYCISVTGSVASELKLYNVMIIASNNTAIQLTSSSGSAFIQIFRSQLKVNTTGISILTASGGGIIYIDYCQGANDGSTVTNSPWSSTGVLYIRNSRLDYGFDFTNGFARIEFSNLYTEALNVSCLTAATNPVDINCEHSILTGGSASAISVGTGSTCRLRDCIVSSSNTNAITGAGTVTYGSLEFPNTSSTINTTTQTPIVSRYGIQRSSKQPAFLAFATTADNCTGNGGVFTFGSTSSATEIFDQNNNLSSGVFTAPYTGVYSFTFQVRFVNTTLASSNFIRIGTSNRNYEQSKTLSSLSQQEFTMTILADMDAGDTASALAILNGMGGNTADLSPGETFFCGFMVC